MLLKPEKGIHVGLSVETCFGIAFHLLKVTFVVYMLPLFIKVATTDDKFATVHKCIEDEDALNRVNRACQLYYPHRIVLRTQGRKFQAVFAKTNWGLTEADLLSTCRSLMYCLASLHMVFKCIQNMYWKEGSFLVAKVLFFA